jgi:hypothetical protein
LFDCSHHSSERRWIRRRAAVAPPIKLPVALARDNRGGAAYERVTSNDRAQRNCVIFGANGLGGDRDVQHGQHGNEPVNLKIDRESSLAVPNEFAALSQ